MQNNAYTEVIDWLYQQFPSYQNLGKSAYKPDLGNILALVSSLDLDYTSLKYIHVAGTNGKGSTCTLMASVLKEKGFKVALFTSPHLFDFKERIRINGAKIAETFVVSFCHEVQKAKLDFQPSFFEITLAMALSYFIKNKVDYVVLETGLGGRLDATNIVHPELSIITNIGMDHMDLLGNTLAQIAGEKAGIMKNKVPVLIGERQDELVDLFESRAEELGCAIAFASDQDLSVPFRQDLKVPYQLRNLNTVLHGLQTLALSYDDALIRKSILNWSQNTGFMGRFYIASKEPTLIFDVSHNAEGIKETLLAIEQMSCRKLKILYGGSNDKDAREIISLFPCTAEVYFTTFSNLRSKSVDDFVALNDYFQLERKIFSNPREALRVIQNSANQEDILLVTGSFFLLSEFSEFF